MSTDRITAGQVISGKSGATIAAWIEQSSPDQIAAAVLRLATLLDGGPDFPQAGMLVIAEVDSAAVGPTCVYEFNDGDEDGGWYDVVTGDGPYQYGGIVNPPRAADDPPLRQIVDGYWLHDSLVVATLIGP